MAISKQRQHSIQILNTMTYNMSVLSAWHAHQADLPADSPVVLSEVEPYPTKLLGKEDQILLAVNNISFQEVKDTQGAVNGWEKAKGGLMHGWKGISFRALFSLNDGDGPAIRNIIDASRIMDNHSLHIPFTLGDIDDNGLLVPPVAIDGIRPATVTMSLPYGSGRHMVLRFAYRDYEEDFGSYPSVIVEISILVNQLGGSDGAQPYTPRMTWNYSVILNSPSGRIPSDSVSRRRYDATKTLIRSSLMALGVVPAAVGR